MPNICLLVKNSVGSTQQFKLADNSSQSYYTDSSCTTLSTTATSTTISSGGSIYHKVSSSESSKYQYRKNGTKNSYSSCRSAYADTLGTETTTSKGKSTTVTTYPYQLTFSDSGCTFSNYKTA